MTGGKQHGFAADPGAQFQEGDNRSGKGEAADEDAQAGFDIVDSLVHTDKGAVMIEKIGKSDQHCRHPDQTVQDGYQFRHLGHCDFFGEHEADRPANYNST